MLYITLLLHVNKLLHMPALMDHMDQHSHMTGFLVKYIL